MSRTAALENYYEENQISKFIFLPSYSSLSDFSALALSSSFSDFFETARTLAAPRRTAAAVVAAAPVLGLELLAESTAFEEAVVVFVV